MTDATPPHQAADARSRRPSVWDVALAVACLALALGVLISGDQAVPANRDPDLLVVGLTTVAVGALVLRRRYPVLVLGVSVLALLGLVAVRGAIGVTTLGPFIAFYTAVALGSRRSARWAVGIAVAAVVLGALLDPVDLSTEGTLFTVVVLAGILLAAESTRARRESDRVEIGAARQVAELERERARSERDRATLAATQERLRVTRDLHDVIGHAMSVMVVQAGVAERLLDSSPEQARTSVEEIARTGRRSLSEMRAILGTLRDGDGSTGQVPSEPAPTLDDLDALALQVRSAGLPVAVSVVGQRTVTPPGVDLAAYRVVQEALTNCLRHSGASRASVAVDYRVDGLEVEVVDDGPRPTEAAASELAAVATAGHGIAGMRERVAIYGGDLSVGPGADGGFRVRAWFPNDRVAAVEP